MAEKAFTNHAGAVTFTVDAADHQLTWNGKNRVQILIQIGNGQYLSAIDRQNG